MNIITGQYIKEIKALFPSKGKAEREYLKKLAITIDEFCEEESVENKHAIYTRYGKPIDIVYDYYSALDTEMVVKKIRTANFIKCGVAIIIILAAISVSIFAFVSFEANERAKREEIVMVDEEAPVVDGHWDDDGNPIPFDYNPYADSESTTEPIESMR